MLVDFIIIASLLAVAHLLRARSAWLQRWMIPSSMIAGAIGLACGPYGLNLLPFSRVDETPDAALAISKAPAVLIVLVFASLLMGHREHAQKFAARVMQVRQTMFYNLACELGQFGLAMLLAVAALRAWDPALPAQFAVMLPAGFAGGAGTSTVFAQGFDAQGWSEALSVGFAFAAIGQLSAIVGGMLLVNLAVRRRWTEAPKDRLEAPEELTASFVDPQQRRPIGFATVNPGALDPLAWHAALLGAVYGLTLAIDWLIHRFVSESFALPLFAAAMLVGAAVQAALSALGIGKYVDELTMRRLGSASADLLIACSIASIKLSVLRDYALPIAALAAAGLVYSVAMFFVGRWVFRRRWLEPSLFAYGWMTGVVGASVALVRIVDPRQRSRAVEDYGTAFLMLGPLEMALYPLIIWACGVDRIAPFGAVLSTLALLLFVAGRLSGSQKSPDSCCVVRTDGALDPSLTQ